MFRNKFPSMYELRNQIKHQESLNVFWRDFDVKLKELWFRVMCLPYENALQALDFNAWENIKKEAFRHQTQWDDKNRRGQQQLIDIFNKARAFKFLKENIGCSDINFIPCANIKGVKTPDLEGTFRGIKVICEVKTINISNDEIDRRRNHKTVRNERIPLKQGFFHKLMDDIKKAINQLEDYGKNKQALHIVYIILNLDDFWGTQKVMDFQDIDKYLGNNKNLISGIKIVFHNHPIGYPAHITMKFATVVNETEGEYILDKPFG